MSAPSWPPAPSSGPGLLTDDPVHVAEREGTGGGAVPELLDIQTLARALGDTVRHVRRLVAERRIPYVKVGHFIRFDPAEVNRWLDQQRVEELGRTRPSRPGPSRTRAGRNG